MKDFYENYSLEGLSAKIFNVFLECTNLREFIERAGRIIGHPIHVLDNQYRILAFCLLDNLGDIYWEDSTDMGYYDDPDIRRKLNQGQFKLAGSSLPREVLRLTLNDSAYGWIVLLCARPLTEDVRKVLPLLRDLIIKISGMDRRNIDLGRRRFYSAFIQDLLEGNIHTYATLKNRMSLAGIHQNAASFRLLTIPLPSSMVKENPLQFRNRIEELFPNSPGLLYQKSFLILQSSQGSLLTAKFSLPEEPLRKILEEWNLSLCISDKISNLLTLPSHYRRGLRALRLAAVMEDNQRIFHREKYKFLDMCLQVVNYDEKKLESFVSAKILEIRNYDKSNGSDYFETLSTFLHCGRNYTLAAKKLFVHKNTITYRIGKLKEIFELNLQDEEEIFILAYSCHLMSYYDAAAANKA